MLQSFDSKLQQCFWGLCLPLILGLSFVNPFWPIKRFLHANTDPAPKTAKCQVLGLVYASLKSFFSTISHTSKVYSLFIISCYVACCYSLTSRLVLITSKNLNVEYEKQEKKEGEVNSKNTILIFFFYKYKQSLFDCKK